MYECAYCSDIIEDQEPNYIIHEDSFCTEVFTICDECNEENTS